MQLQRFPGVHLAYCTNIHPANGLEAVAAGIRRCAAPLRERLSPGAPFGVGLRLSAAETEELLAPEALAAFREALAADGLYVFTLNGYVHGAFHGERVKENVFAPDWRDKERVRYTLRLIETLKELLPEGLEGGISTCPLSYKGWRDAGEHPARARMTENLILVAEALARLREETGTLIHLDLEPEPDGLLETSAETVAFYRDWLLPVARRQLAWRLAVSEDEAEERLLEHVRVCYDTCHAAVAYEEPAAVLERYRAAGIRIGKLQLSSALRVELPDEAPLVEEIRAQLAPFAEDTYLHQVVERQDDGSLRRFPDLPEALQRSPSPRAREWRIHYHVPLFAERAGQFATTQADLRQALQLLRKEPYTQHLEIETYTWNVLPPDLRLPLEDSLAREYEWVLGELDAGR